MVQHSSIPLAMEMFSNVFNAGGLVASEAFLRPATRGSTEAVFQQRLPRLLVPIRTND